MRIRTVKPEFWAHPVMASQSDATKLLAIGLLNLADDEGYFYANAALVRASLRPLDDDSTSVRRSLDDLSRVGYVEVREHSTHGPVGWVCGFTKHQRVDRPSTSKISPLFQSAMPAHKPDSSSARRILDDHSLLEGKGREQGKDQVSLASASAVASETPTSSLVLKSDEPEESAPKPTRPRNENFDALASLNGSDASKLTKPALSAVGVALGQIAAVQADLTPDEIKRRAGHYRLRFPNAAMTPTALAKHWADCEHPPAPKSNAPSWQADGHSIDHTQKF
jgi:hypothetical protein